MSNPASLQLSRRDDPRSQPGTGFDQGGTTDWVALSKTVFQFSFDVLSRLSQAGVEPLTLQASLILFRDVNISSQGEKRVENALDKMGLHPSYTKALWFGLGYRHIIHDIRKTRQGLSCIAICAALSEAYNQSFAAQVLKELFLLQGPPPELSPALRQWISIIDVCAGVLAHTDFCLILGQCSRFYRNGAADLRFPTQPKNVAKALRGLFMVANEELSGLYFSGGPDCAFVAVVAHWILGLSVEIRNNEGDVMYYRPGDPDLGSFVARKAQIIIHHDLLPEPSTQIVRSLHTLPSGRGLFNETQRNMDPMSDSFSYGRSPWETCLRDSFGDRMTTLLERHGETLGKCLGASARIFAGGRGEPDPVVHGPEDSRPYDFDIIPDDGGLPVGPASSTRGFCSMVRAVFPELGTSGAIMAAVESSSALVLRAAHHQYSESMELLWRICDCGMCEETEYPLLSSPSPEKICFLALGEMIRNLIHVFSNCSYRSEDRLRPTTSGLFLHLRFYESSVTHSMRGRVNVHVRRMKGESSRDLPPFYGRQPALRCLHLIFSGRRAPETGDKNQLALSGNGLVLYHETLSEISGDPETVGRICVMAGGSIEWQTTRYNNIVPDLSTDDVFGYSAKFGHLIDDMASFTVPMVSPNAPNAYLILEEHWGQSADTLTAYYTIGRSDGADSRFRVDPFGIIEKVWAATSLQGRCSGSSRSCKFLEGQVGIMVEGEGYIDDGSLPPSSHPLPIIRPVDQDNLAIWVALSQMRLHVASSQSDAIGLINILQEAQCLGCCIRQGAAYEANATASSWLHSAYKISGRNGDWRDHRYGNPDEHYDYAKVRGNKLRRFVCLANPRAAIGFP